MSIKSNVLVVDDEPVGLEVVRALLYDQSYNLHFASNGMEALRKADQVRPDLILLDIIMPGMNGYDVCRTIRGTPHLADIPIILLTALNDRDARIRGIEAGADDFVTKPFDRLELSTRVQTILRLNRYRRLINERAKFAWVVDSADDGYLLVDNDDQIEYANPQARRLLGLALDESLPEEPLRTLAQRNYRLQPPEMWQSWPQPLNEGSRHLVRPQSESVEALWLQVDAMTGATTAENVHLVRLRDVTAEIGQQRVRWSFHSQIQHKFRHPLTVLIGYLDILHSDDGLASDEQRMLIKNAYKASHQLNHEILAVLDYLTTTVDTPQDAAVSLAALLQIVRRVADQSESATVEYDLALNDRSIQLPLSPEQVETIFWELFENAQKFHPENAPQIQITIVQHADQLSIEFADNGRLLPPEQIERVWTPYFQAERYYTGQVPGMGLGLSMIASLIWSSGGTCQAHNRHDGPGFVVQLDIPTRAVTAAA